MEPPENLRVLEPAFEHRERPAGALLDTVVLHATAVPTLDEAIAVLRQRGLGYHFLIDRDGTIVQGCDPFRVVGHAGSSYGPLQARLDMPREQVPSTPENDAAGLSFRFVADCSVNDTSLGVSFVNANDGVDPYTQAQVQACIHLIKWLRPQWPLQWLTTHAAVSPGRKNDPLGFDVHTLSHAVGLESWP